MREIWEFKEFWSDIKAKIIKMRKLDPDYSMGDSSHIHQYKINTTVSEKLIDLFETKNQIELPLSYRTYLMYFGASGASDYCGTLDFNTHISNIDVSNPSKLAVFDGTIMLEPNEDHPIKQKDGIVRIANGYNPTVPFLVLNGMAKGYIYAWNHDDVVTCHGDFSCWYEEWVDYNLVRLADINKMRLVPAATAFTELIDIFPGDFKLDIFQGVQFARHLNYDVVFQLDENKCVTTLHKRNDFFKTIRSLNSN